MWDGGRSTVFLSFFLPFMIVQIEDILIFMHVVAACSISNSRGFNKEGKNARFRCFIEALTTPWCTLKNIAR